MKLLQQQIEMLKTVPQDQFNMGWYHDDFSGCVLVHSRIQGLGDTSLGWFQYTRQFIPGDLEAPSRLWCYGSAWAEVDNTVEGAIKRIEWFMSNGLPENWKAQMYGNEPLCYKDQA